MARQCPKPKRKRDATWFREKILLVEAQGNGKVLTKEEFEFLADPGIAEGPVTQSVITHNAVYLADDLDAYDSDCNEISTAKAVLMANLSSYGSDVLSEVRISDNTNNDMLNRSVQEMLYSEPSHFVENLENEIHSDSNIILYSQYRIESQTAAVQDTNSSAQQDALILSVFEQLSNQVTNYNKVNNDNMIANKTLSTELGRYKEQHENTKILKENQTLRKELKELTEITETWLNNSNKIAICQNSMLKDHGYLKLKDSTDPINTGRILPTELQVNVTDSSVTEYDSVEKSTLSCSTRKAETSKGVIINEPNGSSATGKGNKTVSAPKRNLASVGKLKNVKTEDDIHIIVHTTTNHNDIEWFRKGEALQAKKVKSSNASRSKTPTKRTLIEVARTMLSRSVFSKQYRTEVVTTARYTQNRSTIVKRHLKTPYEIFRARLPNISFLYVFGCLVYIYNHKDHLGKFNEKANDGYSLVSKAFRVFNIRRKQIEETFYIIFDESTEAIKFSKPLANDITIIESKRHPPNEYLHHFEPSQMY
ncbi:reverse transcriptase domain-containing protein [Tanacetum coccineum]